MVHAGTNLHAQDGGPRVHSSAASRSYDICAHCCFRHAISSDTIICKAHAVAHLGQHDISGISIEGCHHEDTSASIWQPKSYMAVHKDLLLHPFCCHWTCILEHAIEPSSASPEDLGVPVAIFTIIAQSARTPYMSKATSTDKN